MLIAQGIHINGVLKIEPSQSYFIFKLSILLSLTRIRELQLVTDIQLQVTYIVLQHNYNVIFVS